MHRAGSHIEAAILRAINAEAGIGGDRQKTCIIVEAIRAVDWASVTFVGARTAFDLRIEGGEHEVAAATDRLVAGLPDREIPIAGHIVAEIAVTLGHKDKQNINLTRQKLVVNALTITD